MQLRPIPVLEALSQVHEQVFRSQQLVHSTRSLELFTHQALATNPRTFDTENTTSIRHHCQSLFLNSGIIGSMDFFRTPQDLSPTPTQPATVRIRIDPSSSVNGPQVRFETRFYKPTASGRRIGLSLFIQA